MNPNFFAKQCVLNRDAYLNGETTVVESLMEKSKLLRGPSVGTGVSGIGRSKASRSMLADGWCLCNVQRWHIGWWVGAKSAQQADAKLTELT